MGKVKLVEDNGIFSIEINNKTIGTIHLGSKFNPDNENRVHINIEPKTHSFGYKIGEVKVIEGKVYIHLFK